MNKKILTSLLVIGLTIGLIGGATFAYFYDRETSATNTFTASELNLTVDSRDDPLPVKFTLSTLRPGRNGTITYKLVNRGTIPGYIDIQNVTVEDVGGVTNDAERAVDLANAGDLSENIDINVNIVKIGAGGVRTYVSAYNGNLSAFAGDHEENVHLGAGGALAEVIIEWEIPDTVGNEIQGDIVHVNITFELAQKIEQ